MEESLVIIKPDAFERGLCLDVLDYLVTRHDLIHMRAVTLTEGQVRQQYSYLAKIDEIVALMVSRPVYVMIFKGEDVVAQINADVAAIRAQHQVFGEHEPLLHASFSKEDACIEIKRFFGDLRIVIKQWECAWCGKTGSVMDCCKQKPLLCECGNQICPNCGGLLSSSCIRKCAFFEDESECAGTCIKCGWSCCRQED